MKKQHILAAGSLKTRGPIVTRREFLGNTLKTAVGSTIALGFPTIVPAEYIWQVFTQQSY
ncbi:MAG: hypothetical protein WKI04_06420 [Ferruginibacter sp.]